MGAMSRLDETALLSSGTESLNGQGTVASTMDFDFSQYLTMPGGQCGEMRAGCELRNGRMTTQMLLINELMSDPGRYRTWVSVHSHLQLTIIMNP